MNKDFEKNFFTCLLAVLLVISNLLCKKLTNVMGVSIGIEFITFPFTFLCTLLILNLGDKKEAYRSILSASIIQLLITISYTIAINLNGQEIIPDQAVYLNELFVVEEYNILTSVLAFILSHCLLIYIYDSFRQFKKESIGVIIGLLGALILNSVIYLGLTLKEFDFMYKVDRLFVSIVIDFVMIIIITVVFYILKEHKKEGKSEKIVEEEIKNKSNKTTSQKKNNNYKNKNTNYKRKNNSQNKRKSKNISQKNVKNENN